MSQRQPLRKRTLALAALVVWLGAAPVAAEAQIQSAAGEVRNQSIVREGGFGAAAAVINMVYAPFKIAYAIGGLTLGGLAWVWTWGDTSISSTMIEVAMGGDYVVTVEHLGGASDLEFARD